MVWPRNDPDPLEERRRQLAEQERRLTEQMSRLTSELQEANEPSPVEEKPVEPPVWRREDDGLMHRVAEPTPARKRILARQRQRDMIICFILLIVLVVVLGVVVYMAYVRNTSVNTGA